MEEPTCYRCGIRASEDDEHARIEKMSPGQYVREQEGTYNSESNRYCCTPCYIEIGMPSIPWGQGQWKAP